MRDKRAEKIKKHFDIQVDGRIFKIMNYIISEKPEKKIRLITKLRGQKFPRSSVVKIEIENSDSEITVQGRFVGAFSSRTCEQWVYEIINNG